jgi:hypothetical protein
VLKVSLKKKRFVQRKKKKKKTKRGRKLKMVVDSGTLPFSDRIAARLVRITFSDIPKDTTTLPTDHSAPLKY